MIKLSILVMPETLKQEFRLDAGRIATSQQTEEGWMRVYMRVARPNWDYKYSNLDGTQRVERINADALFNTDSTDTLKMVPAGIGHPLSRKVTPFNVDNYLKGSTGHAVIREPTIDGEFLGIVGTIYSQDAQQALKRAPGISPGYSVKLNRDSANDTFLQQDRRYNHLAIGVIPRGGADVSAMFNGIRVDAVDDNGDRSEIWVAHQDSDCYAPPINHDLIIPILERKDSLSGLSQKTTVHLDRYLVDVTDPEGQNTDDCGNSSCSGNCSDDCSGDRSTKKKSRKRKQPKGFGTTPGKEKPMTTTDFLLDGVTYPDVPVSFAQAVAQLQSTAEALTDRNDGQSQELVEAMETISTLQQNLDEAAERFDSLASEVDDLAESMEETDAEERTDGEITEHDLALACDIAATVDQMRSDGLLMVDLGLIKSFNTDFAYIAENMGDLQKEMIGFINPNVRVDSYDDGEVAIAYETSIGTLKVLSNDRTDGNQSEDSASGDQPEDGTRQDGAFNRGGYKTLGYVGKTSRMNGASPKSVRAMLKRFAAQEEKVFEDATNSSQHLTKYPSLRM